MADLARVLLLAVLAVLASEPPDGAAGAAPRLGEQCQLVQRHPVSFAIGAGGEWEATFAFAGGAARGHLPLPGVDAGTVAQYAASVADVRLGSYERGPRGPTCRVAPTYHFYCPATGTVDRLCLTWRRRHAGDP